VVDVSIVWDDAALAAYAQHGAAPRLAMDAIAGKIQVAQKAACPVSPVYPVSGATAAGGRRHAGDFPLRPSGRMRSSIRRVTEPATGDILIGPTDPAAKYVIYGTEAHEIRSSGPWPLRNRATGAVFGRVVQHPGTTANNFVLKGLEIVKGVTLHVS
jgi:hypothetical protein